MPKSRLPTFTTAFSQYTATAILGSGGSGRVFLCEDGDGASFAVKVLDAKQATKDKLKRFRNECGFGLRQPHKNIVPILDHGVVVLDDVSAPFFVMKRYEQSLRTAMTNRVLNTANALSVFLAILDGVEAAHLLGVVHRDLKPENILCSLSGSDIVIADFGIAHFSEETLLTSVETAPHARLANFQYAAPEQRARGRTVDTRADIYALGLMLNELFTQEIPHGTSFATIASVAPEFSYLDGLVDEMLRQVPEQRPLSIEAIKAQIRLRGDVQAQRQRLDELQRRVVTESELTDPLAVEAPRVVDAKWQDGFLHIKLSRPVHAQWVQALHRIPNRTAFVGYEQQRFGFNGDWARVDCRPEMAQQLIDSFKPWLPAATATYAQMLRDEARRQRAEEEVRLEQERRLARIHLEVNQRLKI